MRVFIAMIVTLALTACVPTESIDATIKNNLPATCKLVNTAHAAFIAASASGDIKQSTIDKEAAVYAGIKPICDDPASVDASTALVAVATAYATISRALKEAS